MGSGPVVQIILRARDGVSSTVRRIRQEHQALNSVLTQTNRAWASSNQAMAMGTRQAAAFTGQVRQSTQAVAASRQETEKFRISFLGMLRVMAMFAINLQIIRAATSPFTFFSSATSQAAGFQQQLSMINALLRTSPEEMKTFGRELRRIAGDYGIAVADIASGAHEIASSIDSLVTGSLTQAQAVTKIVEQAARGVVVDGASAMEVANALLTTLAALQVPVSESDRVLGLLFATVDVGRVSFQQISQEIGTFSSTMRAILPKDAALAKQFTEEIMSMFAALTQVMPASEAATGVNRLLMSGAFSKSKGEQKIADTLSKVTGIDVTQTAMYEHGPLEYVRRIGTILGTESPLIQQIAAGQSEASDFTEAHFEALKSSTSGRLVAAMFKNVRALRPILLLMQNDAELLGRVNAALADSISQTDRAITIAMDNLNKQVDRFGEGINSLKISIATPFVEEATDVVRNIADAVNDVTNQDGFDELTASTKIKRVLDAIVFEINRWWAAGGREKVGNFTEEFVSSLMTFLNTAVINNTDKLVQLGVTMSSSVIKGIFKGIMTPEFLNPLNNPLVGGALLAAFLPGGGNKWQKFGRGAGIAAAVGSLGGGGGSFIDSMLGYGLTGLGIASMFRGFGPTSAKNTIGGLSQAMRGTGAYASYAQMAGAPGRFYAGVGSPISGVPYQGVNPLNDIGFRQNAQGRWVNTQTGRFASAKDLISTTVSNPWSQIGIWEAIRRSPGLTAKTLASRIFSNPWVRGLGVVAGLDLTSRAFGRGGLPGEFNGIHSFERGIMRGDEISANNTDMASALLAYGQTLDDYANKKGYKPSAGIPAASAAAGIATGSLLAGGATFLTGGAAAPAAPWIIGGTTALFTGVGTWLSGKRDKKQYNEEAAGQILAQENQILSAFGISQSKVPTGVLPAILQTGRKAGLEGDNLLKFVAFNLGVIAQESGFDPTAKGDSGASYGLYQLYTNGGQGDVAMQALGLTDPNALLDPVLNTTIGAGNIAAAWGSVNPSDPNFFFRLAQNSGHPNASAAGIEGARAVESYAKQFYERAISGDTFSRTGNGGVTSKTNTVTINGDLNLNLQNVGDLDDFIDQLAERVAETR